jgi:hypothetical protein
MTRPQRLSRDGIDNGDHALSEWLDPLGNPRGQYRQPGLLAGPAETTRHEVVALPWDFK